jgi:ABC-2 type transport system ATP-binding protein
LAGQYAVVDEYLTGRENVEMVGLLYGLTRRETRRRATAVLERIGLMEAADRAVRTYSGGMRRRLDLAASLVGEPAVLFLDEPTTGVDPASRQEVWALVRGLVAGGTTVVLTTQYLDEADRLADRIAVIDHGRLVTEGTSDQLKNRFGGAVVEVGVADVDRERLLAALARMGVEPADGPGGGVVVAAPRGPRSLREVLRGLDAAGVVPESVGLRKPTLDEVFLRLTGHGSTGPADRRAA